MPARILLRLWKESNSDSCHEQCVNLEEAVLRERNPSQGTNMDDPAPLTSLVSSPSQRWEVERWLPEDRRRGAWGVSVSVWEDEFWGWVVRTVAAGQCEYTSHQ